MSEQIKSIKGSNIYTDKKGRTIYYDSFTKTGYIIPPSQYNNYANYSIRFVISVIVGCVSALFLKFDYLSGFFVGLSTYVAYTYLFHRRFLSKMTIDADFKKPQDDNYIERNIKEMSIKRAYTIILVALVLLVMIAVSVMAYETDLYTMLVYCFIAILATAFIGIHAYIIIKKRERGLD